MYIGIEVANKKRV